MQNLKSHIGKSSITSLYFDDGSCCLQDSPGGFYASGTGYYVKPGETGIGMITDSWLYNLRSMLYFFIQHVFSGFPDGHF